ncbi:MAG: YeeE/YedE family protein [Pseudomonadota bacterium]
MAALFGAALSELVTEPLLAAGFGLAGGLVLGLAARIGRFCTLGALEDWLYAGSTLRLRMWGIALASAIAGVFVLAHLGQLDLGDTLYATQPWSPVASILGGLIFGYGMAIAGNCGFGALARAGGGDFRSLVIVLVMGLSAYAFIGGPLAPLRIALQEALAPTALAPPPSLAKTAAAPFGLAPLVPALAIALAFAATALASPAFRRSRALVGSGLAVGLAIAGGWWGTAWLAETGFDPIPVESHSFTAPIGESMLFVMTSAGSEISFGVGSVAGVLIGAFIGSLRLGHYRWEACDDPRELGRQLFGAFLMGIGGVLALGCSVGQGLTAFSTLAPSAPLVLGAIVIGARVGLRQLIQGLMPAGMQGALRKRMKRA